MTESEQNYIDKCVESIKDKISDLKNEIIDLKEAFNKFQVDYEKTCVELFGKDKDNGLRKDIRENKAAIKELTEKPSKQRKAWIPIIISICALVLSPLIAWIWMKIFI